MWIGVRSMRRAQLGGTSSVCRDMAVSVGVAAGRTSFERGCSSSGSGGGGAAVTGDQPPQPAGRATDRDVCLMQLRLRAELEACTSSLRPTDRHQKNSLPHTHTHTHTAAAADADDDDDDALSTVCIILLSSSVLGKHLVAFQYKAGTLVYT